MKSRNPFSDLGMVIAVSVCICIITKCVLFGFTWGSIAWLVISCGYFFVSWKYPSEGKIVKMATSVYLALSVIVAVSVVMFDKNTMPKMHAFEGTGDTIRDEQIISEGPKVTMYDTVADDTLSYKADSTIVDSTEVTIDDLIDTESSTTTQTETDSIQ